MGSPFTQELGARAGQGAKCLPRLHPPSSGLGHISPCLSTNSMITPITPASSAGAGEASHCPKGEPKLNFPVQSHFQKLWVPYCSHWLHFALQTHDHTAWQCWSWRQLLTLGHILYQPTNLVHPCKCRNYMSVETEELPRETETQAEKVSTGLPPLEG